MGAMTTTRATAVPTLGARNSMAPRSTRLDVLRAVRKHPDRKVVRTSAKMTDGETKKTRTGFRGWTPKGFRLDDEDVQTHIETLDRDQTRKDQFRSRNQPNYNPRHKVVIKTTDKVLEKAARKAKKNFVYEETMKELSIELVHLQEYVKANGLKVVILFEGRDAAGKRYIKHLPSAGEIVLFDRSWYNRAGVERVMGFCTDEEYEEFMRCVPLFEEMLANSGVVILKYWFSVSSAEQEKRFIMRMSRSWKRWKLSPMDLFSRTKWEEYSKAKDVMMERTATEHAPWWIIPSTNKKEARLNCISHILAMIDYAPQEEYEAITLPSRGPTSGYIRPQMSPNVERVPIVYNEDTLCPPNDGKPEAPNTDNLYTKLSAPDDLSVGDMYQSEFPERSEKSKAKKPSAKNDNGEVRKKDAPEPNLSGDKTVSAKTKSARNGNGEVRKKDAPESDLSGDKTVSGA